MVMRSASYPELAMWKVPMGSIYGASINTVPGPKGPVNPSGTEARRTILRFCSAPSINAPTVRSVATNVACLEF